MIKKKLKKKKKIKKKQPLEA